jgi:hypothetical protein
MNLAVSFKARVRKQVCCVASATIENCQDKIQLSLTRQNNDLFVFGALKRTAKFILSLRDQIRFFLKSKMLFHASETKDSKLPEE